MTYKKLDTLEQLLGSYFHQDWPDEFDGEASALQAVVDGEPEERIKKAVQEIDRLLSEGHSEAELRKILVEQLGCYFDPSSQGKTFVQWLELVREKFSAV